MLSALPNDGGYVGAVGEALDTHKRNSDLQGLYEKLERLVERDFADISRVHKEEAAVVLEGIHKKLEDCAREEAVPLWRCLRSKLLEKEKLYTRIREEETRVVGTLTLDGGRWQSMRSVTEEQVKVSPVVRRPEPLDHGQESPRPLMTIGMGLRRGRGENNTAEQNTLVSHNTDKED